MKILVFDNYDSFTYNLVHLVEEILQLKVDVFRNDQIPLEEVKVYDKIILSPGPGIPQEAGLLLPLIREYAPSKSILGVCLGHQAIGEAFGAKLTNLSTVFHGVATAVNILQKRAPATGEAKPSPLSPLFRGLAEQLQVGRYHSWVVQDKDLPAELEVTAWDENHYIMGLQHRRYDLQGLQFHPESVLTPEGKHIMRNWLSQ